MCVVFKSDQSFYGLVWGTRHVFIQKHTHVMPTAGIGRLGNTFVCVCVCVCVCFRAPFVRVPCYIGCVKKKALIERTALNPKP